MLKLTIELTNEKDGYYTIRVNGKLVARTQNLFMAEEYVNLITVVCNIAGVAFEFKKVGFP